MQEGTTYKPACAPPHPVPARKTQRSGTTFRRAVFSAKEVPSAQDLSPRAQTHLPFGCSVVGVRWKPKASLNLQKKFHLSVCAWFLISDVSESATGPVVYALVYGLTNVGSNSTTRSFCTFCHLALICIQSCPFFFHAETRLKERLRHHLPISVAITAASVADHGCPLGATKTTFQHLCQWMEEQKCCWQSGRQRLTVAASVFTEKH